MYKYHHHLLPTVFDNFFVLSSRVHDHYTRTGTNVRTNIRKFSIKFSGPSVWNNIPTQLKLSVSVASLKHGLTDSFIIDY